MGIGWEWFHGNGRERGQKSSPHTSVEQWSCLVFYLPPWRREAPSTETRFWPASCWSLQMLLFDVGLGPTVSRLQEIVRFFHAQHRCPCLVRGSSRVKDTLGHTGVYLDFFTRGYRRSVGGKKPNRFCECAIVGLRITLRDVNMTLFKYWQDARHRIMLTYLISQLLSS